jgi:ABC-type glycerol-3-phosphate transport system substrate-binding protein
MTRVARFQVEGSSAFRKLGGRSLCCAWLAFVLLADLTACNSAPLVPTLTPPAPSSAAQTLTPNSAVTEITPPLASPPVSPPIGANRTITLTVWAPEEFSPEAAQGGQVLQHQVEAFAHARPEIAIKFVLKSPMGKGGLLDFLVKVQSLVPERLPDLILIDSREVDAAAHTQLLQPLDRDLPSGAFADLLPPAQALAEYDGQWLTLPLTLDVQHLAYNNKVVSEPPATWDELLKAGVPFAFPADDDDAFLFQYLENRGRISDSQQPTPLNVSVTTSVLTFYQRARAANLVPDSVLGIKTVHEVWPLFAEGQVPLAQVEASDYLAGYGHVPNAGFAPLPTQDGVTTTMVSGWNYAIITKEPLRHAAAAEFLNWIDEPSRLGEWAAAAQLVPARRSAFAISIAPNEYGEFLLKLLDAAIVGPTFAERAVYGGSWHSALQAVLRGQATPGEAALRAAQALAP